MAELDTRPGKRVVLIPPAGGRLELLRALAQGLSFRDWFGWNWDALEDSLRDLSWIDEGEVLVHHLAIPHLSPDDLRTYLAILTTVVLETTQSGIESSESHSCLTIGRR